MEETRLDDLLGSIEEMKAHRAARGTVPAANVHFSGEPDPRTIRARMGLSQEDFSHVLGISVRTLQNWEQGRREPTGPAVRLLQIAAVHPDVLLELS